MRGIYKIYIKGDIKVDNKVKKYLQGYETALYEKKCAEEELEEYYTNIISTSTVLDGMPKSENTKTDLSKYMHKLDKLKKKYIKKRYLAVKKAEEIINVINRLDCISEKKVLKLRYIKLEKWEEIVEKMEGYSERQVYSIHGNALKKLQIPKSLQ